MFEKQFADLQNACLFADAIVATVREPLLVLDENLRVIAASRAFYARFKVNPENTDGKLLYELGDGQWDIPELHALLEKIIPEKGVMDDDAFANEFPGIGQRTMLLNARQVFYETDKRTNILLGLEDITARRILELEKDELLQQKDVLLHEMQLAEDKDGSDDQEDSAGELRYHQDVPETAFASARIAPASKNFYRLKRRQVNSRVQSR